MDERTRDPYRVSLSASAERVRRGHSVVLQWKAIGVEAPVASTHLSTAFETRLQMIENVATQGRREVIFEQTGWFTFCLTVTFGDGAKCICDIAVIVDE
jgi:hypothetical protein